MPSFACMPEGLAAEILADTLPAKYPLKQMIKRLSNGEGKEIISDLMQEADMAAT